MAQRHLQLRWLEMRIPRADRAVLVIEYAHQLQG
jgi:hypothetical protein